MSIKQDRVFPRTPAALEQKYNFNRTFAEVMGYASTAQKAAESAQEAANKANQAYEGLDQKQIFDLLTNNGEAQGIYCGEDGQIYINASYLAAGVITSADGTVKVDLLNNKITIKTTDSGNDYGYIELTSEGIHGYGRDVTTGEYVNTLVILPGATMDQSGGIPTQIHSARSEFGLVLSAGEPDAELMLGINDDKVSIKSKTVSWQDNGDGTFTLIGR